MSHWPRHGRIAGPIVMIGFGSIGKGTLPLIERHFEFDQERFVVIDPNDADRKLLDERGVRFVHLGLTRDNYRDALEQIPDRRRRPGLLRQPLGRHLLARHHALLPRARRALHRHRRRAVAGLLLRQVARQRGAHQLRAARDGDGGAAQESGRTDRRLLLRRQSRHGLLVRQAGARQPRPRSRRQGRPSRRRKDEWGRLAQRLGVKGVHIAERDTQRAKSPKPRNVFVNTWSIEGFLSEGHAAGRARLGHAREMDAGQRRLPQERLRRGDLPQAARRQHPRALMDPDRAGAVRLPRHPQRVRSRSPTISPCATRRARRSTGRPATTPITRATTRCCRCTNSSAAPARSRAPTTFSAKRRSSTAIDELGVLLYGHARNAYWYGSQLSVEETRALAPYQNATGMQVTSAVLAGMVWALENPQRRHRRGRRNGFSPLPRDPVALSRPGHRRLYRLDAAHGSPRPLPRGHRRERSLAVPQRAGAIVLEMGAAYRPTLGVGCVEKRRFSERAIRGQPSGMAA